MSDKIQYYTLSEDRKSITPVDSDVIVKPDGSKIFNPTVEQLNAYGRYTLKDEKPDVEEGKVAMPTGDYSLVDNVICVNYKILTIVDNPPELDEKHEIIRDFWEVVEENYVHKYVVVELVDNPPEYDPEHQRLEDLGWHINEEETQKIHDYRVITIIDVGPEGELPPNHHWETHEERISETEIKIVYVAVPNPVLVISKMYLEIEIAKRGLLEKFDQFIDQLQLPVDDQGHTIPARRLYAQANVLKDDNPYFSAVFSQACTALEITEEEGREILKAAEARD